MWCKVSHFVKICMLCLRVSDLGIGENVRLFSLSFALFLWLCYNSWANWYNTLPIFFGTDLKIWSHIFKWAMNGNSKQIFWQVYSLHLFRSWNNGMRCMSLYILIQLLVRNFSQLTNWSNMETKPDVIYVVIKSSVIWSFTILNNELIW